MDEIFCQNLSVLIFEIGLLKVVKLQMQDHTKEHAKSLKRIAHIDVFGRF
jgi:hypothetical protein